MIESAAEFIRLRFSERLDEQHRASHEEATDAVWQELITQHPDLREWVVHNKTVPVVILEALHTDPSVKVRWTVAGKRKLPPHLQEALAADADASVRRHLAYNAKATQTVLQKLAGDKVAFVREAAIERLRL